MKRFSVLLILAGGAGAFGQSTFVDSCGSPDWFASCTFTNACGPGQNGCLNNWFSFVGCGTDCPLPFPGPTADVLIPAGAITTLASGSANIHSVDAYRLFLLNGGSFTLRADSSFNAGLNWTAGSIGATSPAVRVFIPAGSPLSIFGNNGKSISSVELVLDQAATWEDGGAIGLTSGAKITNNAFFVARTDSNISHVGGAGVSFENNGTFRKLASNGTTILGLPFFNNGTIEVLSGTLRMSNGGTSFGPIQLSFNTVFETSGGNYNFDAGTSVIGTGLLRDNGQLNLLANVDVDEFELSNSLNGPGNLRIVHQADWLSGSMSNGGTTIVPSFASLSLSTGNGKNLNARNLQNSGLMTIASGGNLNLASAADLTNAGTLDFTSDASINFVGGAGCTFSNSGTIRKSAGTGLTQIGGVPLMNTGTVDVQTGTLRLANSGVSSGPFTLAANTILEFSGGNYSLNAGSSITGDGLARLNGNTIFLGNVPVENSELSNLLVGPGNMIVSRAMQWLSGTMTGGGTTVVPANSTLTLSTGNGKTLGGRGIQNDGLLSINDAGNLNLASAADLTNNALLDITGDASINFVGGFGCTFNNTGTIRKSGGTGLTQIGGLPLNNGGTVQVQSGTLRLSNGGVSSGPFTLAAGTVLEFFGGNYSLNAGSSITGDGLARMNGGTTLLAAVPVENSELSNSLSGPGNLTISRAMQWISGTMTGGGTTIIPAGSTLTLSTDNGKNLGSRGLQNSGTMTVQNNGNLNLASAADITNNSLLDIAGDASINYVGGFGCTFSNLGTIRKSAGSGITQIGGVPLINSGAIQVQTGTLRLANNGVSSGPVTLAANTVLESFGGNFQFDAGASVLGDGLMRMNGNTILLGNVPFDHVELSNNLTGPGDLIVQRDMNWISGSMANGGATVIPAGSTLSMSSSNGKSLSNRNLTNSGITTFDGSGNLNISSAANIANAGLMEFLTDASINFVGGVGCSFNNSGTIRKVATSGTTSLSGYPLMNIGAIDVQTGTISISNLTQTAGSTRVASGATLQFGAAMALQGGTLRGAGAISGGVNNTAGRVQPGESAGLLAMSAAYTQGAGGTLDIDLGGTTPITEYDRLSVGGAATLGGELRINLVNGFIPSAGQQFTVLTASNITGTFATISGPGTYSASYTPTSVIVTVVTPPCMGDVNGDNQINLSDLTVLLSHFGLGSGATLADGDLDGDGDVDLSDLAALLGRFGASC